MSLHNHYRLWHKYERLARLTKSKPKSRKYRNRARKYWPEAKRTLGDFAAALCIPLRMPVFDSMILGEIYQVETYPVTEK